MPSYVETGRCDGCRGAERVWCAYVCPLDLMHLDPTHPDPGAAVPDRPRQARNREPDQCSECYACVKACPRQAVLIRHYADLVALGVRVQPQAEGTRQTHAGLTWVIRSRNGTERRLTLASRTRPDLPADPYAGKPAADLADLGRPGLCTGPDGLHAADPGQLIRT
jgi:adenylylsulfate reductase subunit B